MAIEHARICGACERECPAWADRCPACGSLSLRHRITFVPVADIAAPVRVQRASAGFVIQSSLEPAANGLVEVAKSARKSAGRSRATAVRDSKPRATPLAGEPETRAV